MKKFIYSLLVLLFMVFLIPFTVRAEENNDLSNNTPKEVLDSTIIKFDYYPGGTLSKDRELTFEWISVEKMDSLVISLYNQNDNVYIDVFDLSWNLEDLDSTFDVEFKIVDEPIDDPLTPDIDETEGKFWEYKLTFKLKKDTYGLLKFLFVYECDSVLYENEFYLPNVVYPSVVVPPTPPTSDNNNDVDNDNDDKYFTTSNAIITAVFATICSVIGTLLIIFSYQYRKFDEEELK